MGDPETEVVMPRLKSDIVPLLTDTAKQQLADTTAEFDPRYACTIVTVSGGYPGDFKKRYEISGLENNGDSIVFHAGTKEADGKIITNGGRVLCVTSLADTLPEAIERSKEVLGNIHFTDMYYRKDIGFEFV